MSQTSECKLWRLSHAATSRPAVGLATQLTQIALLALPPGSLDWAGLVVLRVRAVQHHVEHAATEARLDVRLAPLSLGQVGGVLE